jgi:hypothetical protein
VKSLTQFWRVLAVETAKGCHASASIERDIKRFNARFEHEGESFLTITLPSFGKNIERCLERGMVDPNLDFHGWKYREGLPVFLGGFLDRVFDRRSGDLLDAPDEVSIRALRQLTLLFGKMWRLCDESRTSASLVQYVETDKEVGEWQDSFRESDLQVRYQRMARLLCRDVFVKLDEDIYYNRILPKHGPGATAERITGNGKFNQIEWTDRLEAVFPYGEYAIPSWRYYYRLDEAAFLDPGNERPVRVVTVPKTQEKPRIIAIEPVCMQYMQQGLMEKIVNYIETDAVLGAVIGFADQSFNQQLAREGSFYGHLATLDLSEASDRVSYEHVVALMHDFPFVREGVTACRSTRASVPAHLNHDELVIELNKFASMGSALCFPFEAMVFTTVIAMAIEEENIRVDGPEAAVKNRVDLHRILRGVRVYGDDIVVPVQYVACVIRNLEAFGLKVNTGKSFWKGNFRESCGKEYYSGVDVSLVRVRHEFPSSRKSVTEMISMVSLRNQLFVAGYHDTAEWLDDKIMEILPMFPFVLPNSPILGRWTFGDLSQDGWDPNLHVPLVTGYVVKARPPLNAAVEETALMKWFLKRGNEPFPNVNHLTRSGRPDAVYLKRRTVPITETIPAVERPWDNPWR